MKKTVLILSNHDVLTYKFRKEVIQSLLTEDYRVVLSLPYGEKVDIMKSWGCEFHDMSSFSRHGKNPVQELCLIFSYMKLMKQVKPDVVLAYTIKPNLYGGFVTSLFKIPFIANITGLGVAVENKGVLQTILKPMYKICLNSAACIFVQNEKIEKFIRDRKITAKTHVLPGSGVNLQQYSFQEYPKEEEKIIFSTIGRLMKDKGTDEVLEAAKLVKEEYPNAVFRLIGFDDGNYREKVEQAVKDNVVEYYEFQDEIQEWMADSHAILHASYHEGMSNVLLEGAAIGRPIIATNIVGCKEIFEEGITGLGCEPKNAEDLARVVKEFLLLSPEQRAKMGRLGRIKVEKEFDRNIVIEAYLTEIKGLVDKKTWRKRKCIENCMTD